MSRSYKKTPGWCDRNPWQKNYANRRLRRVSVDHEIPSGGSYRKYSCSWDICDYKYLLYTNTKVLDHLEVAYWNKRYELFMK